MNIMLKLWFMQIKKNSFHNMGFKELREQGSIICIPGDLCLKMIRQGFPKPSKVD